ncbi:MAG: EFR1 family ferrodoxin [Clostridia bacterium]|nr:EFR1 family ferrodoxin [Clostridia bacterium]
MVLYFSATGNTEFIAKEIAKRTSDECVNLLNRVKNQDFSPINSEKPFVICAPVYVCEIPRFMAKYLKKATFTGNKNVYFILTSGGYCGPSGILLKKIFKRKKMICHGHAEFKMPRNYVVSDSYPMLAKEQVEERITASYSELDKIANEILLGGTLTARHVNIFETLITVPFNPVWCKLKLKAKDFYVEDSCKGCGKCEKLCPLNNVSIVDKKPQWGDNCTHCMACIANCPTKSVQYGAITKNKEAYVFSDYKYVVKNIEDNKNNE